MTESLFDMEQVPLLVPEKLSTDRRRTIRQAAAIAGGGHPLGLVFSWVRRHPLTLPGTYLASDVRGDPFTCGSCRWRVVARHHSRAYPKCAHPDDQSGEQYERVGPLRVTHGAATDVRAWWPACADYDAGAPGMSGDSWRSVPAGADT